MKNTNNILDFAFQKHTFPDVVKSQALMLIKDTLAVGLAGSSSVFAAQILKAAQSWSNSEEVKILGREVALDYANAALVNGFQIHCLEWDAVHEKAVVHAMSVVCACLISECQRQGISITNDRVIEALVVGVDVACGLGISASDGLKFFRPANAGLIGAVIALAKMRELTREKYNDCIGIAYSMMSGTMQAHVEGSIALPMQIGLAARAAFHSIDLCEAGIAGPHNVLEGQFGYLNIFENGSLECYCQTLGTLWRINEISIKPWPCGRASHGTLSIIAKYRDENIRNIKAIVPPLIDRLVNREWKTEMSIPYARLCLPYLGALMLRDGFINPAEFTERKFKNKELKSVSSRLFATLDNNPDPNALLPQRFIIETDKGDYDVNLENCFGSPEQPLSNLQFEEKVKLALQFGGSKIEFEKMLGKEG